MAQANILGTDTVKAALDTKCQGNFTELYAHDHTGGVGNSTISPDVITVEDWTTISSFGSNWSGDNVAYMIDPMGFVHLRGHLASTGTGAVTLFTLPAGYRPSYKSQHLANIGALTTTEIIWVNTIGTVTAPGTTYNRDVYLDGITFKAA